MFSHQLLFPQKVDTHADLALISRQTVDSRFWYLGLKTNSLNFMMFFKGFQ